MVSRISSTNSIYNPNTFPEIQAQLGDYDLLRTLLRKGADPETPTASGGRSDSEAMTDPWGLGYLPTDLS